MSAPLLQQTTPSDNASGVAVTANLALYFDEIVQLGTSGTIRIYKSDGTLFHTMPVTDASQVSLEAASRPRKVIINPNVDLQPGTGYYVLVDAGAIEARTGEDFAGISSSTTFNFTTAGTPPGGGDTTAPTLSTTTPADNATGVAVGSNLVLTFSESVQAGSGNIEIRNANGTIAKTIAVTDATQVSITGNQLTINPTTDLVASSGYYVTMSSGVVRDLANNDFAGISSQTTFNFATGSAPADSTAPTLQSSTPADNATNVLPSTNIFLTFDEAVKAGSGNIEIRKVSGDTLFKSISITDGTQVTFSGSQVTINPNTNLDAETAYYIKFASGVILDLANNPYAGISSPTVLNFTTRETTPPSLVSTTPTNDALNVNVGANIVLTFNEAVKAATFGNVEIHYDGGATAQTIAITDTSQISFSGNQLAINPSSDLLEDQGYYITIASGVIRDLANNAFLGISPGNLSFYTTDPNAPLLVDTTPDDNATLVSAGASLPLWFDEQVAAGSGNIEIRNVSNGAIAYSIAVADTSQVNFDYHSMTIDPSTDFTFGGSYYVTFGPGVVLDRVGNPFAGISSPTTYNFTIEPTDLTPPRMTGSTPIDNAADVDIDADLIATFNEAVKAGAGNIYINYWTGVHARVFDANDTSQITFSGNQLIIDPSSNLLEGFRYFVSWDPNAVTDIAGNAFGSESYPSAFWFTTADPTPPQLASTTPIDNATDVWEGTKNLRLVFNEPIKAGSGNIEIHDALDGSIVQTFAINSSQVYVDGYEVQINPAVLADFLPAKTYYVTLASGVVLDTAGNPFAGIASPSTFNFSTPSDVIFGTPSKETVTGGDNNEIINGLAGWDTLAGGRGDDIYFVQNYERDETFLLLAEDPNPAFNDLDGFLLSFADNSDVSFELVDATSDGLIDQLYVNFTDDDFSAGVIFTTTRSGRILSQAPISMPRTLTPRGLAAPVSTGGWVRPCLVSLRAASRFLRSRLITAERHLSLSALRSRSMSTPMAGTLT